MHIRRITKAKPAPARDVLEILDVVSYILTIFGQVSTIFNDLQEKIAG